MQKRYFIVWFNVSVVCEVQQYSSKENRNRLLVTVEDGRFLNEKALNRALKEKTNRKLFELVGENVQLDTKVEITGILEASESDYKDWIAEDERQVTYLD